MKIEQKIKLYYAFKFLQNAHFFGAVLVPFFTVWAGMTEQTALLIQSWFALSVTVLELPTGLVADKFGRKTSLVLGAVSAAIGLVGYGLYANIYLFLVCESILALAMTFISGADEAWLIDTLTQHGAEKRKTEIVGKAQSFMFAGMIGTTLVGSLIASYISLPATMYLSVIPALALLLVASKMPEPKVHKAVDETFKWQQGLRSLKVLFTNKQLRYLSINLILVAVPSYFVIWLYQPLLQKAGVGIAWFGLIHSLMIGAEILVSNRFGWLERKFGVAGYLKLSAVITALGFFLVSLQISLPAIIVFLLTAGGFGLTRKYFAVGHFHEYVSSTYRASIASSFSLVTRFTIALANVIVGWLFVQSASVTLLLLGLLPLIAVVLVPAGKVTESK